MSRNVRTARARAGRVAALVCAGALALTGCDFSVYNLPLPGGADLGDDPYTVRVKFRDVLDLVPQSSVKVNDVTVGKVEKIELDGWTADVTLALHDSVDLPDNTFAEIRQTSLLGEKFVSLAPPEAGATGTLSQGDVIPLERSGRNSEVEEVLGAMSLLLNGGGVAQLKTIATELNKALDGREDDVRSVLNQLDEFMGQLDDNKGDIIQAIESLNQLAVSINEQRGSIELALDEMPAALASIDRQRDDLVRMLEALTELSSVGTRVIRQSKVATIDSLQQLDPILTKLGEAGDALPKAFQVFLTYPFVDEVVGRNPVQARNLHMGDYTNLSIQLDIDLRNGLPKPPGLPGAPELPELPGLPPLPELPLPSIPVPTLGLPGGLLQGGSRGTKGDREGGGAGEDSREGGGSGATGDDGCLLPPLVCRPAPGATPQARPDGGPSRGSQTSAQTRDLGYDQTLGVLLVQGLLQGGTQR